MKMIISSLLTVLLIIGMALGVSWFIDPINAHAEEDVNINLGEPYFTDLDGNDYGNELISNTDIRINLPVTNESSMDTYLSLIAALYNEEGSVVDVQFDSKFVSEGEDEIQTVIELEENVEDYYIKVFLWDDLSKMTPFSKALTYFDNYAVPEREIFNEVYSDETEPIGWKKGALSLYDQYYLRTVEEDAMVIRHLDTDLSSSSLDSLTIKDIFDFVLDNDTEKMTRLLSNQVSGKFAIEMDFEADLNTDRDVATYIEIGFGYRESPDLAVTEMRSPLAQIRILTSGELCYQHASTVVSTATYVKKQRHTLRLEIDTEATKIDAFLDDNHFAVNEDIVANHVELFNAIRIRTMKATATGSYFKIYGIRVYQIEDSTSEVFTEAFDTYGALPDVASDPSNVVSDLQMPNVEEYGVTSVTSSDTDIIATNGEITRDIEDRGASIYMQYFKTYSNSNPEAEYQTVFKKAYDFIVKASE